MKLLNLVHQVPLIIGTTIIAACGSGSSSNTPSNSEVIQTPEPEIGQANQQTIGSNSLSLAFVEENNDQTGEISYKVKLMVQEDESDHSSDDEEIIVSLTGAVWESGELPDSCTVINNDHESIDMLSGSISCLAAHDVLTSGQNVEGLKLPIAHVPYKQRSINATAWKSVSPSITTETFITHLPNGETTQEPPSEILAEIARFLDVASGSVTNGMIGIVKNTNGCVGGGMVEEIPFGGGRLGGVEKIFTDCLNGDKMLNGAQTTGWGVQVFTETLDQFSLIFDGPPSINFSGSALKATYDTGERETEVSGSMIRIDSAGDTISLNSYSSRCDGNGFPVQPTTSVEPPPGYPAVALANTIQTTFETTDRLFGNDLVSVDITAQLKDQGSILVSSSMGSSLDINWTAGYFPAIRLSFLHNEETETWTMPFKEEFGFYCH